MDGISIIMDQGKRIYRIDFKNHGASQEDTLSLIKAVEDEFVKNPLNSVLALLNVTHVYFHFNTLKNFKSFQEKTGPYHKKVAVIGLKGLQKTGFKTVMAANSSSVKAFNSESEAREWLLSD